MKKELKNLLRGDLCLGQPAHVLPTSEANDFAQLAADLVARKLRRGYRLEASRHVS